MTQIAAAPPARQLGWSLPRADSTFWPAAGALLALLVVLSIATTRAINWDEFYHYSQVEQFARGELSTPMQTLFARIFAWTVLQPGNGVDHILTIRLAMVACLGVAACNTFLIAEPFAPRPVAALSALLYLGAGYVLQHGSSFRTDPMAAALLTGSIAIILRSRLQAGAILLAGALAGISIILTVKSVLYAPAFAGIAWLRWNESGFSRAMFTRLAALLAAFGGSAALVLWWHSQGLLMPVEDTTRVAGGFASGSARKMFEYGALRYAPHMLKGAALAPLLTICIFMVPYLAWKSALPVHRRIALIGLWLPICTPLFYHNTAPYFYVFILPPVAASSALALPLMAKRYSVAKLTAFVLLLCAFIWAIEDRQTIERQKTLVQAASDIFVRPVAYFDFPGMLGQFPKANGFMTPWGAETYLGSGYPGSMRRTMENQVVPLVVANDAMFTALLRTRTHMPVFQPQDAAALRDNYVHFWGPYWVAGRTVRAAEGEISSEFLVPGKYTVTGTLRIDGRQLVDGAVIELARGAHRLEAITPQARLVWGDHLKKPAAAPPPLPYWTLW